MTRPILRPVLLAIGGSMLAGAAVLAHAGCTAGLTLGIPGLLLVGTVLIERWRYKPLGGERPGPDWVATGERFVDPETGKLVTVFYKPATGERCYIGR
jgi:hypothetical protein